MPNRNKAETKGRFLFRSLFLHAWDLADGEIEPLLEWMKHAGLNTLCLASTYHQGWLIHPNHKQHRAFMTEGDVCFFHPHESYYRKTTLRPRISRLASKIDWFKEAGKRLAGRFNLVAWTVGTHNTTLGLAYPQLTVQNVFGDRLPHALCLSQSSVREYLKALCRDLAQSYPLWGIQLEAFDWMPYAHGHHHERDLVGLTPLEQELMGWCFCKACGKTARDRGVDFNKVKLLAKMVLDSAFREAPQRQKNHPRSMIDLEKKSIEVAKFRCWRKNSLNALLREIKTESLTGTDCRLLLPSEFDPELATVADGFACACYQQTAAQTLKTCHSAAKKLPRDWHGLMQCFVQLGMGIPKSQRQLRDIIATANKGGCNGINFYNRSETPPKMLEWLEQTLPAFAE